MNNIYDMGYKRVTGGGATNCNGFRGIRLNMRKISIHKLRVRFKLFFKMLYKWRRSYERAVKTLKKGICGKRRSFRKNSKSRLILGLGENDTTIKGSECRLRSLGRTNSFYTEAIADCLEFIKRNSVSLDDPHEENTSIAHGLR